MATQSTIGLGTVAALLTAAALLLAGAGVLPGGLALAQDGDAAGIIAGRVTADQGARCAPCG